MGLFLSLSGIANATMAEVEDALRQYATSEGGGLTECAATENTAECLILSEAEPGRITVVYPDAFLDWDRASARISRALGIPVFSFHIQDDDLWAYVLYFDGDEVDRFNPIPDWSGEISDEERESWRGSANVVTEYWPGCRIKALENYLVTWNLENEEPGKAYSDDEFGYNDCLQLVDFMKCLKLDYPIDDEGETPGKRYRFEVS